MLRLHDVALNSNVYRAKHSLSYVCAESDSYTTKTHFKVTTPQKLIFKVTNSHPGNGQLVRPVGVL